MVTEIPSRSAPPNLRPLDVFHDLRAVAELIRTCFNLDADGMRFVTHMLRASENPRYLRRLVLHPESASLPIVGYVWEEDGRIVGNTSLIRMSGGGVRRFVIANVAVAPAYRRRGIARHLVQAALDLARRKRAQEVWLQVKEENQGAQALYRELGFRTEAVRATWLRPGRAPLPPAPTSVVVRRRTRRDWPLQRLWLEQTYPTGVVWYLRLEPRALAPSWFAGLWRILNGLPRIRHWTAAIGELPRAFLSWQSSHRSADDLWLAAPSEVDPDVIAALVRAVVQAMPFPRTLRLDLPADLHADALQAAGFTLHETLCWMRISLTSRRP